MQTATRGLKLYDLPDAIREIEAEIIEADGEITEETAARLDHLEGEFDRKSQYLALLSREARAEAKATKEEEDRLKARRTAAENRERRIKDYLHVSMRKLGVERIEGDLIKIRVQGNTRPSIEWMGEPDAIPEDYRRVTVSADGVRLYDDWKAGAELPEGFRVELGEHVRVW